jgi:hypothetical protein
LATSGTCTDAQPNSSKTQDENDEASPQPIKLLPRETGHDIGMESPVPLSTEAAQIITCLRNMKVRPKYTFDLHWFFFFLAIFGRRGTWHDLLT